MATLDTPTLGSETLDHYAVSVAYTLPSGVGVLGRAINNGQTVYEGLTNGDSPYVFETVYNNAVLGIQAYNGGGDVSETAVYTFIAPTSGTSDTYYDTDADQDQMLGRTNAEVDADLDSNGDAGVIRATRDAAHRDAKAKVDMALRAVGLTVPAADSDQYEIVQYIARRLSAVQLDRSRGARDQNGKAVESYPHYIAEAKEAMGLLIETLQDEGDESPTPSGSFVGVPAACRRTCDEYSGWC